MSVFVPSVRSMLVAELISRGWSQTDIAHALGISQAAVSKHAMGKLGSDPRITSDERVRIAVKRVADGFAAKTLTTFEGLAQMMTLVRELENRGPICAIHEEEMPALQGLGCDLCVRVEGSGLVSERGALNDVREAVRILEGLPRLAEFIPKVGTNVARALPGAKHAVDVVAVPGGLHEMRGRVRAAATPEFGASRHVSEVALALLRFDATRAAALNLATDDRLLEAADALGLTVEEIPPAFERDPATLTAKLHELGLAPDVFYHRGDFGVEAQTYVTASTAREAAERARALVEKAAR